MARLGVAERAVEVLHNAGDDTSPDWSVGSGYVVRGNLVLTAAHVVGTDGELLVRFAGAGEKTARVCRFPDGRPAMDDGLDLALVEITGQVPSCPPVGFARLDPDPPPGAPNVGGCWGIGFPWLQEKRRDHRAKPVRESRRLDGYLPAGEGMVEHLATLRVQDAPAGIPAGDLRGTPWEGISGTVVFAGYLAAGVILEHHRRGGMNSLTLMPIARLDELDNAASWWQLLGADPQALAVLPVPVGPAGRLFNAEAVPEGFVERPDEAAAVLAAVCGHPGAAVGVTTALGGAGGFGKSALAAWVSHRPEVTAAFPGGVLWITLGQDLDESRLLDRLVEACRCLHDHHYSSSPATGPAGVFAEPRTVAAAARLFGQLLGEHRVLVVVDDAWRASDLEPFLAGGERCVRLVTTRLEQVVPEDATRVDIDQMTSVQARRVLTAGLPPGSDTAAGPLEAMAGGWVLLARLINSRLRRELRRTGDLATAAEVVAGLLADEGITALDAANETSRARAAGATLTVSLDALDEASRQRFETLAVFPEDTPVPAEVLARVWQRSPAATRGLLADLADDHLVQQFDPQAGTVRLHDVVRRWLRRRLAGERLRAINDQLLEATRPQSGRWSDLPETGTYLWRWAGWHLAEAERTAELAGTVASIDYLARKTCWLGPAAVETDLRLAAALLPGLDHLARRYQQTAHLFTQIADPHQVAANISARLGDLTSKEWTTPRLYLEPDPHWPLRDIDPQQERVYDHGGYVAALAWAPDGRLASGGDDGTVRIWPEDGGAPQVLDHGGTVLALVRGPGGRLASGGSDGTVRIWPAGGGGPPRTLDHGRMVLALAWAPDGRLASGGWDARVRVWPVDGGPPQVLGHGDEVWALAWAPDGRLASGGRGGTVRVGPADGGPPQDLDHGGTVSALAWAPDGRLASGDSEGKVRVWPADGGLPKELDHGGWVDALAWAPDSRLASAGGGTVRIWPAEGGGPPQLLDHGEPVRALAWAPDGRLASSGDGGQVRVWPADGSPPQELDPDEVNALAWAPDGRLASGSVDGEVRVWPADGGPPQELDPGEAVNAMAWAPDTRLASGDSEGKVRVWPADGGPPQELFVGGAVFTLAWAPDGRLASSSGGQVQVWPADGSPPQLLDHGGNVNALAWAPDSRLASGGEGGKVRVWPADGGPPQLLDHGEWVHALAWAPDGTLASGGWDAKVRVWPADGGPPQVLDHGGRVHALAWAPDGTLLASSGNHGEVRLWRVTGHSDQLPGLQLPESEFRFDRPSHVLAVWRDRIACATGGSLAMLRIVGHDESGTGV